MQDVSPTRLPPIDIHVKKLSREPPEKPWPKFKKVLIDYPRDRNLLYRQKLWDFQKLNRGAFRSHVTSLPEIPYRVNTNKPETANVGVQSDMRMLYQHGLKLILPKIRQTSDNAIDKVDVRLNTEMTGRESGYSQQDEVVDYDDSGIDDPGYEFDSVKRRKNASTMTDPTRQPAPSQTKRPLRRKKILKDKLETPTERPSSRKMVKFADEDEENIDPDIENMDFHLEELEQQIEQQSREVVEEIEVSELQNSPREPVESFEVEKLEPRISSASSSSSDSNWSLEAENIGSSSHLNLDPLSVLDFLSGSRVGDARVMLRDKRRKLDSERDYNETPRKSKVKTPSELDADRKWFKKLVGEKDIIDSSNYESYARTRPNDSFSDSNEKYIDLSKNSSRRSNYNTPRINGEFPSTKSQSRTSNYNSGFIKDGNPSKKTGELPTKSRSNSRRTMISIGKSY